MGCSEAIHDGHIALTGWALPGLISTGWSTWHHMIGSIEGGRETLGGQQRNIGRPPAKPYPPPIAAASRLLPSPRASIATVGRPHATSRALPCASSFLPSPRLLLLCMPPLFLGGCPAEATGRRLLVAYGGIGAESVRRRATVVGVGCRCRSSDCGGGRTAAGPLMAGRGRDVRRIFVLVFLNSPLGAMARGGRARHGGEGGLAPHAPSQVEWSSLPWFPTPI
jgi:hypothetical protein